MIQIGKVFADRYYIQEQIGRGGTADVYLAQDRYLDNAQLAIKVLRTNYQTDPIAIQRFQREARAMAELNHPHIVRILDIGEVDAQQYIAMEYIDGVDLKRYIKERAPLSNDEALRIMGQILPAIDLAHKEGFIHRDLKPQNILLTADGYVKVTDFGIAYAFSETALTQTNSVLGTVHYLSPEQARGSQASEQSDIYALGIILFEMLTGKLPFEGDSTVSVALQHYQKPMPSVRQYNANVPQALENVIYRATAKDLVDRYPSIDAMYQDLSSVLSPERRHEAPLHLQGPQPITSSHSYMTQADMPSTPASDTPKQKMSKKTKGIIAAIICALVAIIVAVLLTPSTVTVPSVAGDTLATAERKIKEAHLAVGDVIQRSSDTVEAGTVIETDPKEGSKEKSGTAVTIIVSSGQEERQAAIPDVSGMSVSQAKKALKKAGFEVASKTEEAYSDTIPEGLVIAISGYSAGISVNPDQVGELTLLVSRGKEPTMPDLGYNQMTLDAAKRQLKNLGISEGNITIIKQDIPTVKKNMVVGQDPIAGTPIGDRKVILYVATGETVTSSTSEKPGDGSMGGAGFTPSSPSSSASSEDS